jgi:NTP pyrophosphatase (non-canonical NTP hydrolase)
MDLQAALVQFKEIARAQDWEELHTPANLAAAVSVEAAELLNEFSWMTPGQSRELPDDSEAKERVGAEVADVFLYLLALCDQMKIDLEAAVQTKQNKNRARFLNT